MILLKLIMGHALADFGLQSDWVAINKNRHLNKTPVHWLYVLSAHALIHGMAVWLITGNIYLGLAETAAHGMIDFGKCESLYGIHVDQGLHFSCKVLWAFYVGF